jgi:dipeptidyl aminopeptidase/acylaminoacyl peptidase
VSELEDLSMGNPAFSSRVKAVVDFYGPSDLLQLSSQALPCYPYLTADSPYAPPSLFIGCTIQECREKTSKSNPIQYITPDDPPFLIMHGTADCLVPWQQSQMLFDALVAKGINAQLFILPGAEHGGEEFDEPRNKEIISAFLDKYLKGSDRKRAVRRR